MELNEPPKTDINFSPASILVMNHWFMAMSLKLNSSHKDVRFEAMYICFFDYDGIIHTVSSLSQNANGTFYCDILRQLKEDIPHKWPNKWCNISWVLHHDNETTYLSLVVYQFLISTNMTVTPFPSCSLDLAPCDFSYF